MVIFNERYNKLVEQYIVPLLPYNISYSKLSQAALQDLILRKDKKNIVVTKADQIIYYFSKDELLKALLNDIDLFFIRVLLQQRAVSIQHNHTKDQSVNWRIVTDYYYSFFLAGLLLRLCHRGTFYFDETAKKKINQEATNYTGNVASIGSNCSFQITINEKDSEYSLTLTSTGSKTHELVWEQVAKLLEDIKALSTLKSDEYTTLCSIIEVNNKQKKTYPSQLRNLVNYRPYHGVKEVERAYFAPNPTVLDSRWLEPLLTFTRKVDDEQQQINLFCGYVRYLQMLTFDLIHEYYERRGRGNGILSAINKDRTEKITLPPKCYSYLTDS